MSELEILEDGRLRLPGSAGQVPVTLNLDESLTPPQHGIEKLRRIAALPHLIGHVDVLPDVHFKAKNFIPTGVCVRVGGLLSPMLVSPPNDSMIMATMDVARDEIGPDMLDRIFEGLMARVAMFRRDEPIETVETINAILRFGAPAVAERWGFTDVDLSSMDFGGHFFPIGEEPEISEILEAFPSDRPSRLAEFVPWHDVMTAAGHTLGVLDGGGHFLELSYVRKLDWQKAARSYGLKEGQLVVAAHVGPADVGLIAHRQFLGDSDENVGFLEPSSEAGRRFWVSMGAAANFAFANRLCIFHALREVMDSILGRSTGFAILSDAPHDLVEDLRPNSGKPVYIHRKGVVRGISGGAYPMDHRFSAYGRPFFFPTCLGEDSMIMTRAQPSVDRFDVCSHGLGRSMTREEAIESFTDESILEEVAARGVRIYRYGREGFSAQAPGAHKDVDKIVSMLKQFGLGDVVATIRPLASLKG